jgi:hypothetical protein
MTAICTLTCHMPNASRHHTNSTPQAQKGEGGRERVRERERESEREREKEREEGREYVREIKQKKLEVRNTVSE